jgi:hypothetical protein
MATSDIEKVLTVFRGIASRDAELTTKYMNPGKYTQHNPRAADGVQGLKEYVGQFPGENHHLKVVRPIRTDPTFSLRRRDSYSVRVSSLTSSDLRTAGLSSTGHFRQRQPLPMKAGTLRPTGQLRQDSLRTQRRTSRLSENTTRPFTSLGVTVRSRNTFQEIIASATNPASAMESRHSNVTCQN